MLKRAVKRLGSRAVDRRTTTGRALAQWRDELAQDLGGDPSAAQQMLLEIVVRERLLLDSVDAWLLTQGDSIINRSKRRLMDVVGQRQSIANALANHLGQLGLERRPKPTESLAQVIARRQREKEEAEREAEGTDEQDGER